MVQLRKHLLHLATAATLVSAAVTATSSVHTGKVKRIENSNLTPDAYYHNAYHAKLSMAAYGDYTTLCPNQTFTEAAKLRNFPNSTLPPWRVVSNFGPTASGCEGFTAIVPEMNKALIVFKGNYKLEQTLSDEVVGWDYLGMGDVCPGCTVNKFAAQGYLEAKNATNNWRAIRDAWAGQGLVFSITGHGLGGMHSQIAAVDLNNQKVAYYDHAYGAPRVFNQLGANHYNANFNGEAAERGVFNGDTYVDYFPAGPNYAHAGTAFYYTGFDPAKTGPTMTPCFDGNNPSGPIVDDPGCDPRPQVNSTAIEDHYFYFSNVGQCGGNINQDTTVADAFIAAAQAAPAIGPSSSPINVAGTTPTASASAAAGKATGTTGAASRLLVADGVAASLMGVAVVGGLLMV